MDIKAEDMVVEGLDVEVEVEVGIVEVEDVEIVFVEREGMVAEDKLTDIPDGSGSLPANATPINIPDSKHTDSDGFCPLRDAGPHVLAGNWSALDLLKLFIDNSIMDRILRCTYAYAEAKKDGTSSS